MAKSLKTALKTAADSVEFPFSVISVYSACNNSGFYREILSKVEFKKLCVCCLVNNAYISVAYLSEVLMSFLGFIYGCRKVDLVYRSGNL